MPFLDAIHIFFEPCVTLDVRTRLLTKSVFDREWDMTLEYVLHQPGLNAAYTSSLSIQHDLWVFLVWETEDDRHRFYKQTTGFGFVTDHLAKPPSVFLFGYAIYNELETAPDWTADVITPEIEDGEAWNYQPNAGGSQTLQLLNGHLFVARQEKDTTAQLYDGNDFDYAIIALTKTVDLEGEEDTRHGLQWSRYAIELHKCEQNVYSKTVIVEAPTSIAELIEKEPWEYGLLSPDESKYSDTAYPMNLTFRPMSTLSMAEKFQPDHKDRSTARAETTDEYAMCIIEFTISPHYVSSGASLIDDLRFKAKLEDGADGLRELSVLIDARSPDTIKFLTVWQGMSQLATWWDFLGSVCNSRWSWWTSSVPGLPKLCWEETSLTPDKQDWQEADKILEGVMFTFTDPLTPAEQKASEIRIQDLMNTMSSCWSGDVDTSPVVHAEDPIWIDAQGKMPQCLLFLAWEGVEQREAWLRNFMAQDFTWAGYMAYALKKICYTIHSIDYKMEKIYSGHLDPATSPNKQNQDEGDDSDRDMGF